jgi:hypothetical protein
MTGHEPMLLATPPSRNLLSRARQQNAFAWILRLDAPAPLVMTSFAMKVPLYMVIYVMTAATI